MHIFFTICTTHFAEPHVVLVYIHPCKFVRIQPGSMLQLLYPCSQYSLDKCVLCGGTFRDHLTLWWSKHLYTPYDRYLDQVYHESMEQTTTLDARNDKLNRKRNDSGIQKSSFARKDDSIVKFGYHHQYVLDITSLFENIQKPRDKAKALYQAIQQRYHQSTLPHININTMEQRTWPRFTNQSKMKYLIPRHNSVLVDNNNILHHNGSPSTAPTTRRPNQSFILWFARDLCLDAIDRLLDLQQQHNTKLEL